MGNENQYFAAMNAGRFNPTINVDKQPDGMYRAHYTTDKDTVIEVIDDSQSWAFSEVARLVREGVKNGEITPR